MEGVEGRDDMTTLRCLVPAGHGKAGERELDMWAAQALFMNTRKTERGVGAYMLCLHYTLNLIVTLVYFE